MTERNHVIQIRVTAHEKAALGASAAECGFSLSAFMRYVLFNRAGQAKIELDESIRAYLQRVQS